MSDTATILSFAVKHRWTVTIESERHFVKVRHRTRWYAVARRKGFGDRRHCYASRADAVEIAKYMREGFEEMERLEQFTAFYESATDWQRERLHEYLAALGPCQDRQ